MVIREATVDDVERIAEMIQHFIDETRYRSVLAFDRDAIEKLAATMITHVGVIFVADLEGLLVGLLAVVAIMEPPLGGEPYAEELAWWVEPEYRGIGLAAYKMLGAAEDWATRKRLSYLKMVAPSGSHIGTFYQRAGYEPIETAYLKRLSSNGDRNIPGNRGALGHSRRRIGRVNRGEEEG